MRLAGSGLSDKLLVARMTAFALALPLISRLKISQLDRLLQSGGTSTSLEAGRIRTIQGSAEAVLARVLRRGPTCYERGIMLCFFLRRATLDVRLTFGVGPTEGEHVGHCWLVLAGKPFLEERDPRPLYTEMITLPQQPESA